MLLLYILQKLSICPRCISICQVMTVKVHRYSVAPATHICAYGTLLQLTVEK
jgi:hypothetical protein